jgi:phage gp46-like protein
MGDLALAWNQAGGYADWQVGSGDLVNTNTLDTAIIRSLFTDARAPDDLDLPDPRGFWADTYNGFLSGSLLWLLARSKISDRQALLRQAEGYCNSALAWLVTAGVAATVTTAASFEGPGIMGLVITVTEPTGTTTSQFKYSYLWNGG